MALIIETGGERNQQRGRKLPGDISPVVDLESTPPHLAEQHFHRRSAIDSETRNVAVVILPRAY